MTRAGYVPHLIPAGEPIRPEWMEFGACNGVDPEMFFPEGASATEAKAVCADCPVRAECLEHALTQPELYGIWGGKTARQRRTMRSRERRFGPGAVARCGTNAGYHRHRDQHTEPCAACRAAHAEAERKRNAS